jgi:DNA primase
MQINEIKQNLSLSQVLQIYLIKVDKNKMALCPFHEDKKPSLQVNLSKNYYKCHACGKKGDQIQFVQDYGNLTKREALLKCVDLINETPFLNQIIKPIQITKPMNSKQRNLFLEKIYETFIKSVYLSQPAKDYLKQRNIHQLLDKRGQVGFNSGQFHHAGRFENETDKKEMIALALEYGLLIDANITASTGEKAYQVFGNKSLAFALLDEFNKVTGLYFRSIDNSKTAKHFYLKNRQGLYPKYPDQATKKLILTESIIDCSSLLQINEIIENYALLACYGTNGLTPEHLNAIKHLPFLEEIIFIFDNDKAGIEAVKKYTPELKKLYPKLTITTVETPNKDINETLQGHEAEIFTQLLQQRKQVDFSYSIEDLSEKIIKIEDLEGIKDIAEGENLREIVANSKDPNALPKPIDFLKQDNLLDNINDLLGRIGIVGEEDNRLLQLVTATTYKMNYNLHILYQGSSGSGKTHTIKQIASLMPPQDVIYLTRVTDSSLYNYKGGEFMFKLVIFEDMDGLKEDALLAVREMISNKKLSSSTSVKDKRGNADGKIKEVEVSFASLSATTKGELYEDNMSRIIVLSVDESKEQTKRIIDYKNQLYQGKIDKKQQEKIKLFFRECVALLQVYEVINPYACLVELPENVHKPTRMHDLVMGVINQIVILNQYQRQKTKDNQLIATKQDVRNGLLLMKNSILLKMDELEGKIRTFYEALKKYVENKAKQTAKKREEIRFTRFDIKDCFLLSKTQINNYLYQLSKSEYLQKTGHENKGFGYKIAHWDNFMSLSEEQLKEMLDKLNEDNDDNEQEEENV